MSAQIKIGKVNYAYNASAADEISIPAGEEIRVLEQLPNDWSQVEWNGRTGLFPSTYLEIIRIETKEKKAPPAPPRDGGSFLNVPKTNSSSPDSGSSSTLRLGRKSIRMSTKAKAQQLKILEATSADPVRLEKINKTFGQLEDICKKDLLEAAKYIHKYQQAAETLAEYGQKLANELTKIGEKHKDNSFGATFLELANETRQREEERSRWCKVLLKAANGAKDLEGEAKNISVLEKQMKDANKRFDAHVKQQAQRVEYGEDSDSTIKAMSQMTEVTKEIDDRREEMLKQLEYERSLLLQKAVAPYCELLISMGGFLDFLQGQLQTTTSQCKSVLESIPTPTFSWDQEELQTISPPSLSNDAFSVSAPAFSPKKYSVPGLDAAMNSLSHKESTPPRHSFIQSQVRNQPQPQSRSLVAQQRGSQPSPSRPPRKDLMPTSPSISPEWEEFHTEEGHPYYYNRTTGETTWELPQ